jgi:hypothetical protein
MVPAWHWRICLSMKGDSMSSPKIGHILAAISLVLMFAAQVSQVYGQALSNEAGSPALPLQAGVHEWVDGVSIPTAKNSPFSARVEIEASQSLPDGTTISHKTMNIIGRDHNGRTHNEGRTLVNGTETREPKISFISIYDADTRTRTVLYPDQHLARVSEVRASAPTTPRPSVTPASKNEDLGDQMIEGVEAHGRRITTTYPAGAVGNDRPFDVVNEFWFSKELEMTLLIRRTDPRYGTQTVRVTNINRSPDPALFAVPAGYKVVNESAP